jgi:hypothetical protein
MEWHLIMGIEADIQYAFKQCTVPNIKRKTHTDKIHTLILQYVMHITNPLWSIFKCSYTNKSQ